MPQTERANATLEVGKQVIGRAVAILQTLEGHPAGLNMSQIARATSLPRTTAQRLVGAWVAKQFLVVDPTGRVHLGPALARLAATAHTDRLAALHPHLEALHDQVQETVHLWVASSGDAVLVDQVIGDHEVRIVTPIGISIPFACTAGGKALLAVLPDIEVRRLVDGRLRASTSHSIVTLEQLFDDLTQVRTRGFAIDIEERAEDVAAVGTALRTGGTESFALCIAAPLRRFQDKLEQLVAALMACRERIHQEIAT